MENTEDKTPKRNVKLHLSYIIFIQILIIVGILSLQFYSDDLNNKFMGYVATITSIILSVLAIFITVTANDSTNGLLHKIRDVYDHIDKIPKSFKESFIKLDESSKNIDSTVKNISDMYEKFDLLSSNVSEQLCRLESLDKLNSLDEINNKFNEFSRFLLSPSVIDQATSNLTNEEILNNKKDYYKNTVDNIINKTSEAGTLLMYFLLEAHKKNKIFEFNKLGELLYFKSKAQFINGYFAGYIICLSTLPEYFRYSNLGGSKYLIEYIDKKIIKLIEEKRLKA